MGVIDEYVREFRDSISNSADSGIFLTKYKSFLSKLVNTLPLKPTKKTELYLTKLSLIVLLHTVTERKLDEILLYKHICSKNKLNDLGFKKKCELMKSIINDNDVYTSLLKLNKIRNDYAHDNANYDKLIDVPNVFIEHLENSFESLDCLIKVLANC